MSPGNVLEKQNLQSLPRPADSDTLGQAQQSAFEPALQLILTLLKFGNHCCSFTCSHLLSSMATSFLHMADADIFASLSLNFISSRKSCSTCPALSSHPNPRLGTLVLCHTFLIEVPMTYRYCLLYPPPVGSIKTQTESIWFTSLHPQCPAQ